MAEPTSVYSHYDLLLRVAETAGVAYYGSGGAEKALVPIDEHDFAKCKRVVNDGIKMFIGDAPKTGWRWKNRIMSVTFATVETTGECDSDGDSTSLIDSDLADTYDTDDEIVGYYVYNLTQSIYAAITAYTALTGDITVSAWLNYDDAVSSLTPADEDSYSITNLKTIEGDKARYWLDEDFGRVSGKLTYAKDENRGHQLSWTNESTIRSRREVTVNSGFPIFAATRLYRNQRRWELIVDPSPTEADIINFPYEVGFDELQMEIGTSDGGGTTYITDDDRWEPDDYFNGWICKIISGTGRGSYAAVTDYDSRDGVAVCTDGTGKITVASTAHGLSTGDVITVAGTTDYNSTWAVTKTDADNFTFVDTYTSAQTGTWKQRQIEVADWLKSDGSAAGINPGTDSVYYIEPAFNKHPAGMTYDQVVVSACLAQAEMQFDDIQSGHAQKYYSVDLPRAQEADARTAPRKLGKLHFGRGYGYGRNWNDVTYTTS